MATRNRSRSQINETIHKNRSDRRRTRESSASESEDDSVEDVPDNQAGTAPTNNLVTIDIPKFMQRMFLIGCCSSSAMNTLVSQCFTSPSDEEEIPQEKLKVAIIEIKQRINRFGMDIRTGISEDCPQRRSGQLSQDDVSLENSKFYALVNTIQGDIVISPFSPRFKPLELDVFKRVLVLLVGESGRSGCIPLRHAQNVHRRVEPVIQNLSLGRVQELIDFWTDNSYLANCGPTGGHGNDHVALSPRALIEFDHFIRQDLKAPTKLITCTICASLCVRGVFCALCDAKYHYLCEKKLLLGSINPTTSSTSAIPCVGCRGPYKRKTFGDDEEIETKPLRGNVRASTRRSTHRSNAQDQDANSSGSE